MLEKSHWSLSLSAGSVQACEWTLCPRPMDGPDNKRVPTIRSRILPLRQGYYSRHSPQWRRQISLTLKWTLHALCRSNSALTVGAACEYIYSLFHPSSCPASASISTQRRQRSPLSAQNPIHITSIISNGHSTTRSSPYCGTCRIQNLIWC